MMEKEKTQEYCARVTQANKTELIVIMYEIFQTETEYAKDAYERGDIETFVSAMKNAQKFLNELMGSLDYRYKISYELLSIYSFVNRTLLVSIAKRKPVDLEGIQRVMKNLKTAFEGISKEDKSGPLMENAQKIYAGLTYGRGVLNEIAFNVNEANRGYRA